MPTVLELSEATHRAAIAAARGELPKRSIEYTVAPWATLELKDETSGYVLDVILTALEHDPRVIAPVCGYDASNRRLEALFQVEVDEVEPDFAMMFGTLKATAAFDRALGALAAGDLRTTGLSIVQGGPELLP
jgi:hypothetical protein